MSYIAPVERVLEPTSAAYLAGLIDGEGTIALWRGHQSKPRVTRTYRPVIEISNTHLGVLEWVKLLIGGGWLKQTNPKRSREKGHKPLFRYRFRTTDLHWVIPQVRPYLKIKGAQADLLVRYFESVTSTRPEVERDVLESMWARAKELNHRGLTPVAS